MTVKTIQTAIKVSILMVVLGTCLVAVGANAQFSGPSTFAGKFTLPYEVHWGRSILPPGAYTIQMQSVQTTAIVRSADGRTNMFVRVPIVADSEKGSATCLTILVQGNERTVQSLNLPQLGKSLVYEPLNKAQREELAKAGKTDTLSVASARK